MADARARAASLRSDLAAGITPQTARARTRQTSGLRFDKRRKSTFPAKCRP
ncbi:hypothetical protein [Xanthomonas campestris]|uniref:hypothetical protein n=1 Tax=Xanthomonas campestris TaxID=339 RepID=UPI003001CC72